MASTPSETGTVRRPRRGNARRRILDVAAALLEDRSWHDIALEEVMARADLTRTAFYRHFGERSDLLLALLEESGVGQDPAGALWKQTTADPAAAMTVACEALTDLFIRHGRLLRAAAEAAAQDAAVRAAYGAFAAGFVESSAARIEADRAAGRSAVEHVGEVSRALVWMNERYLLDCFGRRPFTATREEAAAALAEIWVATLYVPRPDERDRRRARGEAGRPVA